MKQLDVNGLLNLTNTWKLVPNNTNIIYILFDNESGNMISIDVKGKLFIKSTTDITSNNIELLTRIHQFYACIMI